MKAVDAYRALRIACSFHIIPESAGIKPRFDTSPCFGEPWLLEIYSSSPLNKIRRALHIKIKSDRQRIDAIPVLQTDKFNNPFTYYSFLGGGGGIEKVEKGDGFIFLPKGRKGIEFF